MLKIEDILREDFDWENVEIDEDEFDELETACLLYTSDAADEL